MNQLFNALTGGNKAQGGRLTVNVVEARNVASKDTFSQSDPYCVLSIAHKHQMSLFSSTVKTTVINNNKNPVWNQQFTLNVKNPESEVLKIRMYDKDFGPDDFIGEIDIPLFSLPNGQIKDDWFQMSKWGGSLHLQLRAEGFGQMGGFNQQGMGMGMGMGGHNQNNNMGGGWNNNMGGGFMPAGGFPPQPHHHHHAPPPPMMGGGYPQPPMMGGGYPQPPMGYPAGYPPAPPPAYGGGYPGYY
eukprot:TRINITY_DN1_c0_g2_i1.p1 TRINITY_DN1_c0_g2~~TRINITY_DN1_c0_g2_i1.p1  ORF type:complete len:243 (-),score=60.99 TRINITY_DN1_c0_g2_i1:115-843(-)